jgi:predicted nucleotidyltransferase
MIAIEKLKPVLADQAYPLCFVTLSGAHLYGFPSADSDYDLRGAHVLPLREVIGFESGPQTIERAGSSGSVEVDLVTHDIKKFLSLLMKRNGYALEQLYSPLVVVTTPEHEELKEVAKGCITRNHHHHYLSFAENEWRSLSRKESRQVKTVLYLFRVLLSGIHLMRTGEVEANLVRLNEEFALPYIPDLIGRKTAGAENSPLAAAEVALYEQEYRRLRELLVESAEHSHLPNRGSAGQALNDLLIRTRFAYSETDTQGGTSSA